MPPKASSINSIDSLRQAFRDIANSLNLPIHEGAFAVDVVEAYKGSEISDIYLKMFGENRTDLSKMARQAMEGRYTLTTLENNNNTDNLATRVQAAIDLFMNDVQLLHDNCVKFNAGGGNNFPELAGQVVEAAKKAVEKLTPKLMKSSFLNNNNNNLSSKQSSVPPSTESSVARVNASTSMVSGSRTRQRENTSSEDHQHQNTTTSSFKTPANPASAATSSTQSTSNAMTFAVSTASNKQPSLEEIKSALATKLKEIADTYQNHPLVSGPISVRVPQKVRERIVAQELAYQDKCKLVVSSSSSSNQQQQANSNNNTATSTNFHSSTFALSRVPSGSSNNAKSTTTIRKQDLVISVLLDFFASFCAKSLNVSKEDVILKKFLLTKEDELISALETSEITNPRNFMQQQQQQQKQSAKNNNKDAAADAPTTVLSSSRKIEQYWAVLSRVILPFFNSMAIDTFVYDDEEVIAQTDFLKVQLMSSSSSSIYSKNPWHKILHYDVLTRSLLEVNATAKMILQDTLNKASSKMMTNSNNNNNELVAMNIVNAAIVPAVNDLLEFIAEEKL